MPAPRRTTVYFDPEIHRALRAKAAGTEQSVSNLVNAAVRLSLADDDEDVATFDARAGESSVAFADVLKALKRRSKP